MESILVDEETKMWRFRVFLFNKDSPLRFQNPVPVFSDQKLVGFASVWVSGKRVLADVVVDYSIPERLDVENGKKVYLDALLQSYPDKLPHLFKLIFNDKSTSGEPIGTPLLES